MNYYFQISGIVIHFDLPFEISISQDAEPFRLLTIPQSADLTIRFCPVDYLDPLPDDCNDYDGYFFRQSSEGYTVYRCPLPGRVPYAKAVWRNPGYLHCEYLKTEEHRLVRSREIFRITGIEIMLLLHNALLLHSSFIKVKGHGILFTAPSGTGKSTQAELWHRFENADILNGDRTGIRKNDNGWTAWGLPYAGSSGIYRNESAPVSAIVVLRQAKENRISSLRPSEAVRFIYPELMIHRWNPDFVEKAMNLLLELVSQVPVYLLECLPDQGAVRLLKETLLEGGMLYDPNSGRTGDQ